MYINKIDDLLDKVIDDFYNNVIIKEQIMTSIIDEVNFVKYQKEINQILINYISTINIGEIRELVKHEDTVQIIINIIKRYIAIYFFLTIGVLYKGKEDTFINNIVEFTKNQSGYGFKIENFFNSENNALVIRYYKLINNIITIINTDKTKLNTFLQKSDFKEAIDLLNLLGQEYVDHAFRLEYLNNNVHDQYHNIIKTIIILLIYKKTEKENVFKILESVENEQGEYMFIDIVIPRKQYINFSTVENLLSNKDFVKGLAHEFWNFILDQDKNIQITDIDIDDKILKLIDSKILIPIVDDFLLYHKDTEKYDKMISDPTKVKKKEDTKIRYIVTKIDKVSEYYSESVKKDPKLKAEVKKLFYMPLMDRKAVLYNNNEEIRIINKLINQGRKSIENNEYYNDLLHYRKYPYINFKDFKDYGFSLMFNKTVDLIRAVSFESERKERNIIQLRIGSEGQTVNVVGFAITSNILPLECLKVRDFTSINAIKNKNQNQNNQNKNKDKNQNKDKNKNQNKDKNKNQNKDKNKNQNKDKNKNQNKDKNKNKNGFELISKYLQQSNLNTKPHIASVFWLFDLQTDNVTMDVYEQFAKLNSQEQVRYIISKLYDDILNEIYYEINEKLNTFKSISFYDAFRIIKQIEKRSIILPSNSDLFNKLEEKIFYEKYEKEEAKYDENDDKFPGLSGNVIKLPRIPDKEAPPIQIVKIDIAKITQKERNIEFEEVRGLCQHNITWENITALRKQNPNKYADMLYAFIEQYLVESNEHEYICKSCGFLLNIKKYIIDGVFDDDTERFITFSMPMEVPLEDIPEYEKYIIAIRNIDKLVEKVASIANMPYFLGTSPSIKWRRKSIIKDTIDILLIHNNIMKKNFKERNMMATKLYGISRELSNLFIFDLDNSIFVYSSKEKDYFKNIKHNNVIAYILILMILEINNSHITFMSGDKKGVCNYQIFEKYGNVLFEGLKIRKNKNGDLTDVKRYKILSYILYIVSCMATRYNLWHYEYPNTKSATNVTKLTIKAPVAKSRKIKFDPKIQKIIIHTIIDVLNSLLEVSSQSGVNRLYEIISTKFYRKMRDTFNNSTIINMFKSGEKSSISIERKDFIFTKINNILLTGKRIILEYDTPYYRKCKEARYFVKPRTYKFPHYYHINNITNCPTGEFHNWVAVGKIFVCSKCGTHIDVKYDEALTKEIKLTFKYVALKQLAHKYCLDGTLHNYIYDDQEVCSVCNKCKLSENYEFSHEELDKLEQNINKYKNIAKNRTDNELKAIENHQKKEKIYEKTVIDELIEHYNEINPRDNPYKYIDTFLNDIQSVIGTGTNINGTNILLKDNLYEIDHDQLGYPLDRPIIISDTDNRIFFKSNHPFFKTDVIYYTSHKAGKLDVFYDATTHILLGYKENSKDYVRSKRNDKKLKLHYSIANKLKLLGYSSQYINIGEQYDKFLQNTKDLDNTNKTDNTNKMEINDSNKMEINDSNREEILKDILSNIIRKRIYNLKKVISQFQRFIWKIKNNTSLDVKLEKLEANRQEINFNKEEVDPFTELLEKYQKKLSNINLESEPDNKNNNNNNNKNNNKNNKNKDKIFKHWNAVINNIFAESLEDKVINIGNDRLINAEEISKYDINGNYLLFYIVSEIDKLIQFNQNKFIKTNAIMFIIDFINLVFNLFNTEDLFNKLDIKRFFYIINSKGYLYDIEQKGHGLEDTQGIYEEYQDPDEIVSEEQMDIEDEAEEEAQALDVDMNFDDALDYIVQLDDWEPAEFNTIEG